TTAKDKLEDAKNVIEAFMPTLQAEKVIFDEDVAKVSIVGAGMESHSGFASKMFEALYNANINIQMISTSEIKISVLIKAEDADRAVSALHSKFFD
ncbi:MAG: ACT domain-containing protein, partial [Acutalibacteraceae bacterium]|nr:ACT domain-containing protein [Acutalibacteraceae bacterium]